MLNLRVAGDVAAAASPSQIGRKLLISLEKMWQSEFSGYSE